MTTSKYPNGKWIKTTKAQDDASMRLWNGFKILVGVDSMSTDFDPTTGDCKYTYHLYPNGKTYVCTINRKGKIIKGMAFFEYLEKKIVK